MHALCSEVALTANDLTVARFDNYHLDFWSAFTVPAGKRTGYNNMVGSISDLVQPSTSLPSVTLNLPLPFFYSRDSGCALPTASLPYNELRLSFAFRDWTQLLIVDEFTAGSDSKPRPAAVADLAAVPQLQTVQVWGTYAIVSNDERRKMGCSARDILIEQVQTAPLQNFSPSANSQPSFDIRFAHSIKALFFAARNKTCPAEWSNYTSAVPQLVPRAGPPTGIDFTPAGAADPIATTSLIYESTARLQNLGSDYFSLIQPWYYCPAIPLDTGYHVFNYSLDLFSLDPLGSTNYGKLTNVSIAPVASATAITANTGGTTNPIGSQNPQFFDFIVTALSWNINNMVFNSRPLLCGAHVPQEVNGVNACPVGCY